VLGRYVREQQLLTLESAIHKMTALSAAHVGLTRRGTIAPGYIADLVLFDPATVIDRATPAEPHLVSEGVSRVWVNGKVVWEGGKTVRSRSGRVLRRQEQ
jgi:N-acyl-D-amino-acid deacylase